MHPSGSSILYIYTVGQQKQVTLSLNVNISWTVYLETLNKNETKACSIHFRKMYNFIDLSIFAAKLSHFFFNRT